MALAVPNKPVQLGSAFGSFMQVPCELKICVGAANLHKVQTCTGLEPLQIEYLATKHSFVVVLIF
jgi:hypothetical protein